MSREEIILATIFVGMLAQAPAMSSDRPAVACYDWRGPNYWLARRSC